MKKKHYVSAGYAVPRTRSIRRLGLLFVAAVLCALLGPGGTTVWGADSTWAPLVQMLAADGFDTGELRAWFQSPALVYDPRPMESKLRTLHQIMFGATRVAAVQKGLARLGFESVGVEGRYSEATAVAIRSYQERYGRKATGLPERELLENIESRLPKQFRTLEERGWTTATHKAVLKPLRTAEASEFILDHRTLFAQAERRYGVPAPLVAAILNVETRFGSYAGRKPAFVTLASMALAADFKLVENAWRDRSLTQVESDWLKKTASERGAWAYDELKALLRYGREAKQDPATLRGSEYGALGLCQFMPTSYLKYGVDGDGDGTVDLFSIPDAIASVAAYLQGYGWQGAMELLDERRKVIWGYNHSQTYVNTVLAAADALTRRFATSRPRLQTRKTVSVTDARSLLQAIAPGTRVLARAGTYDLSQAHDIATAWVRWEPGPAGAQLVISGVGDLVLEAEDLALLVQSAPGATVLTLRKCRNVLVKNFAFSHAQPGAGCLLACESSTRVSVQDCLFFNGGLGIELRDTEAFELANAVVQGCTSGAIRVEGGRDIRFRNLVLRANSGAALIDLRAGRDIAFSDCFIKDNRCGSAGSLFALDGRTAAVLLKDSCLVANAIPRFSTQGKLPVVRNCVREKNGFR